MSDRPDTLWYTRCPMPTASGLAIEMGCHYRDIALTIHPHPTLSEGLYEAALQFDKA